MSALMRKNEKYIVATRGPRRIVTSKAYQDHLKRFAWLFPRPVFPEGLLEVTHYTYYRYRSAQDERWKGTAMIDVDACISANLDMLNLKKGSGIIADDHQVEVLNARKFPRLAYDPDQSKENKIVILIRGL